MLLLLKIAYQLTVRKLSNNYIKPDLLFGNYKFSRVVTPVDHIDPHVINHLIVS